jgi:hypothetical protein
VHFRLTYANVVATLALFVALGGSSYAAVQLGDNSVTSRNIAKGQVKASDLAKSSVTSTKVKDGSLLATDFQAGQLPAGPAGATGRPGAQGPAGLRGERGLQGAPGLSGLEKVTAVSVGDSASPKVAIAKCAPGKEAIGAGYDIEGGKEPSVGPNGLANVIADVVEASAPGSGEGSVIAEAWEEEPTSLTWAIHASAISATVSP